MMTYKSSKPVEAYLAKPKWRRRADVVVWALHAKSDTCVAAVVPFYAPHDLEFQAKQNKSIPVWVGALFDLKELNDPAWKILRDAGRETSQHLANRPKLSCEIVLHDAALR